MLGEKSNFRKSWRNGEQIQRGASKQAALSQPVELHPNTVAECAINLANEKQEQCSATYSGNLPACDAGIECKSVGAWDDSCYTYITPHSAEIWGEGWNARYQDQTYFFWNIEAFEGHQHGFGWSVGVVAVHRRKGGTDRRT